MVTLDARAPKEWRKIFTVAERAEPATACASLAFVHGFLRSQWKVRFSRWFWSVQVFGLHAGQTKRLASTANWKPDVSLAGS